MKDNKKHIEYCFQLIEQRLGRDSITSWNTDDFRILSERIKEATGTLLSISTLKRLSGKVSYSSKPNITTLDALAKYIGFKDWLTFLNKTNRIEVQKEESSERKNRLKYVILSMSLAIGLGCYFLYSKSEKKYNSKDFTFVSRRVSHGIPNSVVFDYNASAANHKSKIEIQQDWDDTKRIVIDKSDSVATSIYYYPGFFKTKLVVDNTIVKENDVYITTQDWMGIIEQETKPIYLTRSDIFRDTLMAITPETVASYNLDPSTSEVVVSFYQVRDFGELYTDNFEMSTTLKNDFKEGIGACQLAQINILYDGGALGIPLGMKGCSSDFTLMTFDEFVDGKKNDLSNFGVDFNNYIEIKCISKNRKLEIFINDKFVYRIAVPEPALKIKGIAIHFEGAGSIKNVELRSGREVVYSSKFD